MRHATTLALLAALAGCPKSQVGTECAQDGTCPQSLKCFPDWRCYPKTADPACDPPCYGDEPFCDKASLRCVACLSDGDCPAGQVCAAPILRCQAGCNAAHPGCADATLHCDLALGVCRGCLVDSECPDPANKHCEPTSGLCGPCTPGGLGCPAGQYCSGAPGAFSCAPGCTTKDDCPDAGTAMDCCGNQCVDTSASVDHCGVCGNVCRGGKVCCSGQCADLATDVDNCSTCGKSCVLANVQGIACSASVCSHSGCESFFGNCDGDWGNGCETNLSYDPLNCAVCNNACAGAPHAQPACDLTRCTFTCDYGWGNCDTSTGNGCETPLLTDVRNCGRCNGLCGASQVCDGGQCE